MKTQAFSLNSTLVATPWEQGNGLKNEVRNGFAFVKQKTNLGRLELLVEAQLPDGNYLPKGTAIYIQEDVLETHEWSKKRLKAQILGDQEFVLVPLSLVIMVDSNENI